MHHTPLDQLIIQLKTNTQTGLTSDQVSQIQQSYGKNTLPKQTWVSIKTLLLNQLQDAIVWILLFASVVSFMLGEIADANIILIIIILNGLFGFYQEFKAEQGIQKLLWATVIHAKVIRDGHMQIIDSVELVPGDLVVLEAGDKIAADIRFIETNSLFADESLLTWESLPVAKDTETVLPESTPLADQKNMCFAGTSVTKWSWKAIVTKTGIKTQLGSIVSIIQAQKEGPTPLQIKLKVFSKQIGTIVWIISLSIFILGWLQWKSAYEMFFIVVSLAVSSIPEGLIAVVTITLALATQKLFKQNALVRKIKSIESLGTTTVICTDKTGTLTQNHMTVTDVWIGSKAYGWDGERLLDPDLPFNQQSHLDWRRITGFQELCNCITYCNNAALPNVGDPTEIALMEMTKNMNVPTIPRTWELPFDSDNKYMITYHEQADYIKGSVEKVLELCDSVLWEGNIIWLSSDIKEKILEQNNNYARSAIRVLGCAYVSHSGEGVRRKERYSDEEIRRKKKKSEENSTTQSNQSLLNSEISSDLFIKNQYNKWFTFVGLVWMIDPPRDEVSQAIQQCYQAGMKVVMITWDHLLTAQAIAHEIWLQGEAMEGSSFEAAPDKLKVLQETNIFARVTPAQKVMICEWLKQLGEHVVMTWDGVNDAAALKAADIGFAMGITGTEVTKDASDIVLLDDNFATIVNTIRQGRIVYDNIKKFIKFMLAVNFDEMIRVIFNFMIWLPVPMTALQILWINLVTDGLPTLALWFDEGSESIMKQKPRSPKEWLLQGAWIYIIGASLISSVVGIWLFYYYYTHYSLELARTVSVVSAVCFEMFLIFSVRDVSKPVRQIKPNRYLVTSVLLVFTLQFGILYTAWGKYFDFTTLDRNDILICLWSGLVGVIIFETKKLIVRRFQHNIPS